MADAMRHLGPSGWIRRVAAMRRSVDSRELALIVGSGLAMGLLFLVVRTSLIDDAYITLSYARNLATDLHWGLLPQEVANTATSPLNVLLLGALSAVTRIGGGVHPVLALGALSVGSVMVMAWGWSRILRRLVLPWFVGALGVAVVLGNAFVLSSIGLEVLLIAALLTLLVAFGLDERPVWFGVVGGLTILTRLDLVVVVVVIAAFTPAIRRRPLRAALALALTAAPWFLFSWIALGSAIPDTLLIKTGQKALFAPYTFTTGPVMYFSFREWVVLATLIPAVVGLLALIGWLVACAAVRWEGPARLPAAGAAVGLGAGAVVYFCAYVLLQVPPFHWYYVPTTAPLAMFGVIAVGLWWRHAREDARLRPLVPALVLGLVALVVAGSLARAVAHGVPWRTPLITTNFATAGEYADVGLELRDRTRGATVENRGEVGTIAYFCECPLVEGFSDRGRLVDLLDERIENAGPLSGLFYELNYAWLDRDQEPRPHRYTLVHAFGPPPNPGPDVWALRSPWSGPGHVTLSRVP